MRRLVSVVGDRSVAEGSAQAAVLEDLGSALVEAGHRILTGGVGDLPRHVAKGARASPAYLDGDLLALLPGHDPRAAEGAADIVIPTGLDVARNVLVAAADAVVAVGGGAGTLSEVALAWQLRRPVLAWTGGGWSAELAGKALDHRRGSGGAARSVIAFKSGGEAAALLEQLFAGSSGRHRGIPDAE